MAEQTYSEPPGRVLRFPDGHTVKLVGGQRVHVPAGTVASAGIGDLLPQELTIAGLVITTGTPGETQTTPSDGVGHPQPVPHATPPPRARHQKPWQETPEGAHLDDGYHAFRDAFQTNLPASRVSLQALAKRPLGG